MIKSTKIVLILLLSNLSLIGCSSLNSRVINDPTFEGPNGNRIYFNVRTEEGKDVSETLTGKLILSSAKKWANQKGFKVVEEAKKSEIAVNFTATVKNKEIEVPGQTYSTPIYGNNSGTTTTVKNVYGQNI